MKKLLMLSVVVIVAIAATASLTATKGLSSSTTYTVAGVSSLLGSEWDPTDTRNDMTDMGDGSYQLIKKNVPLQAGVEYEYKVVAEHSWVENYGENGMQNGANIVITVPEDGNYDVTFTFTISIKILTATATKTTNAGEDDSEPGEPQEIGTMSVSAALNYISELTDVGYYYGSVSYVKGYIVEIKNIDLTYGEATFYISDTKNGESKLLVPFSRGLLGIPFVEDGILSVGDEVVVCGKLAYLNYVQVPTPLIYQSYLYSTNSVNVTESYISLLSSIDIAQQALNQTKLTQHGQDALTRAIALAKEALATHDDATINEAKQNLEDVVNNVKNLETLISETIVFSNEYTYYYGRNSIKGDKVSLTPAPGTSSSSPYEGNKYLYLYSGNTLTFNSDETIAQIQFWTRSGSIGTTVDCGQLDGKKWYGETTQVTFTQENSASIDSVTVFYDIPSAQTLIARIALQVDETEKALQQVVYRNVPGYSDLQALVETAKGVTDETDYAVLKSMRKNLSNLTAEVVALDQKYQSLESLAIQVESTGQNNGHADASTLENATADIAEIRQGLSDGAYSSSDIDNLQNLLNSYLRVLTRIYLYANVETEGELGNIILDQVENFTDVYGLHVSGYLNSDDWYTLKNRMTGMRYLDMAGLNTTAIAEKQFSNNTKLYDVVLPNTLETIGNDAFSGCTYLESVSVPSSLKTIGARAFQSCPYLQGFSFPEGLLSIGEYAFYNRNGSYYAGLKTVELPSTLTTLGDYAFQSQDRLESVTIAGGITSIGSGVFYGCSKLKNLVLPPTIKSIGSSAFYQCTSLVKMDIPESVTSIGSSAFYGCTGLTEVYLPSTIQSIAGSFNNCGNITKMTCRAIIPPSANSSNILGGQESKCTLTVPNLSIRTYKQTAYWDQFNIVGEDYLPEQINITSDFRLSWPDDIPEDYQPAIVVSPSAALSVSGNSTLSSSYFRLYWDTDYARNNTYSDLWGNTTHVRDNYYSVLMSNGNIRSDVVSVTLYDRVNEWDFLSFPFDVKVGDLRSLYEGTPYAIRKYDGQKRAEGLMNETWVRMTSDSILHAGQGYIWQTAPIVQGQTYNGIFVDAMQTVNKNNIFTNDDVEVALNYYESEFPHNRSWNLIGNPYPAYYDIRAMQTSSPVTVWDTYSKNYRAYSPLDDAYILNPGQAFFVQRPVNEESITFLKEGRQIDMTVRSIDYTNRAASITERSVFNVVISGGEMNDRTRFVINNTAQMDYEEGRDASKFMSDDEQTVEIYTMQDDILYSINERPFANGIVEIGVRTGVDAMYTITLDANFDNEVYLIDRETGTETRIDGTEGYSFYANKGSIEGRFAIRLVGGVVTGIKNVASEGDEKLDTMYDVQGRRIVQPRKGLFINNGKKVVVK